MENIADLKRFKIYIPPEIFKNAFTEEERKILKQYADISESYITDFWMLSQTSMPKRGQKEFQLTVEDLKSFIKQKQSEQP